MRCVNLEFILIIFRSVIIGLYSSLVERLIGKEYDENILCENSFNKNNDEIGIWRKIRIIYIK